MLYWPDYLKNLWGCVVLIMLWIGNRSGRSGYWLPAKRSELCPWQRSLPGESLWRGELATLTLAFSPWESNPFGQFSSEKERLYVTSRLLCGHLSNEYRLKAGTVTLAIGWSWAAFYLRRKCLHLKIFFIVCFSSLVAYCSGKIIFGTANTSVLCKSYSKIMKWFTYFQLSTPNASGNRETFLYLFCLSG